MKILIATQNFGKLKEFQVLLRGIAAEPVGLEAFPEIGEIAETGRTFEENALIKARTAAHITGLTSIADDSGLEVDYLNGAPGVFSARFAGENKDDGANTSKLLDLLEGVPPERRTARFRCVIAIVTPEGEEKLTEGSCEGLIAETPKGESGFGYDPVFYLPEFNRTMAQLSMARKNAISHRGSALRKAVPLIVSLLENG